MSASGPLVRPLSALTMADVAEVGGKNASLGEMLQAAVPRGVRIPDGFATTARAYRLFLEEHGLREPIAELIRSMRDGSIPLQEAGAGIRRLILGATLPDPVARAIREAYIELGRQEGVQDPDVAVRSSATAEDLPEASFAGQQESFLNVVGEEALLDATLRCFASLFTDRAISYREERGIDHLEIALSVGVQRMVRSDLGSAGVLFTLDPNSGFPRVVVISSAWRLGESVVKGSVNPDQFVVFKSLLDRRELSPIVDRELGSKEEKVVYAERGSRGTRTIPTTAEERAGYSLEEADVLVLARWGASVPGVIRRVHEAETVAEVREESVTEVASPRSWT